MYLSPELRYDGASIIDTSEEEELYSSVVCFMLVFLKKSIPLVIRALPITRISAVLLIEVVEDIIRKTSIVGITVRAISTDNHSVNINLYTLLKSRYPHTESSCEKFVILFDNMKIYLIFDVVYLIKNIRNNWLKVRY